MDSLYRPQSRPRRLSAWLFPLSQGRDAALTLFCFPYAGGSAAVYRRWPQMLPPEVQVVGIQLPGRGHRLSEPAVSSMGVVADALAGEVVRHGDREFAFLGHSMGALIGFEVARRLEARDRAGLRHLFVSGRRAPSLPAEDKQVHKMDQRELVDTLRRLDGTPPGILDNQELMELMLPALRADFAMCETYEYRSAPPLSCPITAVGGDEDRGVSESDLRAWAVETRSRFRCHLLPGGHFFVNSAAEQFARLITEELGVYVSHGNGSRGRDREHEVYQARNRVWTRE